MDSWIEIKGQDIESGDDAWMKAIGLANASDKSVYVLSGSITGQQQPTIYEFLGSCGSSDIAQVWWHQCPWCLTFGLGLNAEYMWTCACFVHYSGHESNPDIFKALMAARQADFKAGEVV